MRNNEILQNIQWFTFVVIQPFMPLTGFAMADNQNGSDDDSGTWTDPVED